MPENIPFFRIFLSSLGDVNDERKAVLEALERLPNRPTYRARIMNYSTPSVPTRPKP